MDRFDIAIAIIIDSSCPIAVTILSILFGMLLLRKHYYVNYLPWAMSIAYLFLIILYVLLCFATYYTNYWLLNILCNQDEFVTFLLWGGASIIASFVFSLITSIYFSFFYKVEYIKYKKSYMKLHIYVTLLPTIIILFFWYLFVLGLFNGWSIVGFLYMLLLFINAMIYIVVDKKLKTKSKTAFYIKFIINIILFLYLVKSENAQGFQWYILYHLIRFFSHVLCEVRRSKREDYPNDLSYNEDISLLRYVPIIVMVFCCLLISVI